FWKSSSGLNRSVPRDSEQFSVGFHSFDFKTSQSYLFHKESGMSRRAVASRRRSRKSNTWMSRLRCFKRRFPRLLRTDFWRSTRSDLTNLFGRKRRKSVSAALRRNRANRKVVRLQHETLEERRVLSSISFMGSYAQDFNSL